jgi:hypothetical protein
MRRRKKIHIFGQQVPWEIHVERCPTEHQQYTMREGQMQMKKSTVQIYECPLSSVEAQSFGLRRKNSSTA